MKEENKECEHFWNATSDVNGNPVYFICAKCRVYEQIVSVPVTKEEVTEEEKESVEE